MQNKYVVIDHPAFKPFVELTKSNTYNDYIVHIGPKVFAYVTTYKNIECWIDKGWIKPYTTDQEYTLLKDFITPTRTIKAGVTKEESQWMNIFNMNRGECSTKTDWFKLNIS